MYIHTILVQQRNVAPLAILVLQYMLILTCKCYVLLHNYLVSESWSRLVCYFMFIFDQKT